MRLHGLLIGVVLLIGCKRESPLEVGHLQIFDPPDGRIVFFDGTQTHHDLIWQIMAYEKKADASERAAMKNLDDEQTIRNRKFLENVAQRRDAATRPRRHRDNSYILKVLASSGWQVTQTRETPGWAEYDLVRTNPG